MCVLPNLTGLTTFDRLYGPSDFFYMIYGKMCFFLMVDIDVDGGITIGPRKQAKNNVFSTQVARKIKAKLLDYQTRKVPTHQQF